MRLTDGSSRHDPTRQDRPSPSTNFRSFGQTTRRARMAGEGRGLAGREGGMVSDEGGGDRRYVVTARW